MLLRLPWQRKPSAEVEKAVKPSFPAGSTTDMSRLADTMTRYMGHYDIDQDGKVLPRPEEWLTAQFGPQWPLPIEPLDRVRPDSGMPEPRQWEYPFSWNLQLFDQKSVNWETLKLASESPIFRACIEVRKNELAALAWQVRVNPVVAEEMARQGSRSKVDVENELRDKYKDEIQRVTDFWTMPDRRNGRDFGEWISVLAEEQLVWDAMAVYPRRTFGGELSDLMILDGSTIKPLLDEQGGRPLPPAPAYQQILYGFPRGEFTADAVTIDGEPIVNGGMTSAQLIYRRRVVRTRTPYGMSPTEQALLDGLLYSKRFGWMLAEYTEGSQPAQFMTNKGEVDWSARQLLQYEKAFNDRYGGQTAERFRYPILPPGIEPHATSQVPDRYRSDYDLHLIARVGMHFGVQLPELGFIDKGSGLGSTGYHEGQEAVAFRRTRLPEIRWYAAFLTFISMTQLDMPKELEINFLGLEEEDANAIDEVINSKIQSGRLTLNEARQMDGLPAYNFGEADMPQLQTARGIVFIQGAADSAPAGILIEPASEMSRVQVGAEVSGSPGAHTPGGQPTGRATSPTTRRPIGPAGSGRDQASKDVETFRKWLAKNADKRRRFEFDVTYEEALDIDPELIDGNLSKAIFKAATAGPKASSSSSDPYSRL